MEQAQYWMWAKRKQCLSSYGDSAWEEEAFAEDSAGSLGGCIWPPRSYSCSFCSREFRSAQALGGHMNVHRRDKARLKQSPSPSRVSTPSNTQGNYSEQTLVSPSYSSSSSVILQENQQHTKGSLLSLLPSWSDSVAVRVLTVSDPEKIEGENNSRLQGGVAVNWNLVVHRNQPAGSDGVGGEEETAFISKRRRSDDASSLPFFLNSISVDKQHLQSEVLGLCRNPMEDLDLELRLGDGPR
ncbi:hypothetical protein NE237_010049 [Protea cynaroides]|uniref:C2H2-type domain-containing protein n=1 Tax=Protea cynaroides TaxID=273540 RepID=A0A9Q0KZQ2_9MAGN|nr:hypothetical protein NE237_010049 [Protea cynaroides]